MTKPESKIDELQLIKQLIALNGLSISKAAEVMKVQRTNLSSWINGKLNVFSTSKIDGMLELLGINAIGDSSSGVRLYLLSNERAHRWQVEGGAYSFIEVLRATEENETLKFLEIFEVNTLPKGRFNIVRRKSKSGDLYILISNKDSSVNTYPISPEIVGFGMIAGTIEVPVEKWITWLKAQELSASTFRNEISIFMDASKNAEDTDNLREDRQFNLISKELNHYKCKSEGLKTIMRALLGEVRKLDTSNPLLDDKKRKATYSESYRSEARKLGVSELDIDIMLNSDL